MPHRKPSDSPLLATILETLGVQSFPEIRSALEQSSVDAFDRDQFLLNPAVAQLVHSLVPDQGLGEAVDQLAATVHHGYLCWDAGSTRLGLAPDELRAALAGTAWEPGPAAPMFLEVPPRLVWADLQDGVHEPLDGVFAYRRHQELVALGVFGNHPAREGFTVAEAVAPPGLDVARPDGSPLFSPTMEGGREAGLFSLVAPGELALLVSRSLAQRETAK